MGYPREAKFWMLAHAQTAICLGDEDTNHRVGVMLTENERGCSHDNQTVCVVVDVVLES